jgi:hypothetical protein
MSEKKLISRNTSITLGILSIVLLSSLAGTMYYYSNRVRGLIDDNNRLQTEVKTLTDRVEMNNSTVLVNNQVISQPANSSTVWWFQINYTGYITVSVSSTSSNTYVQVVLNAAAVELHVPGYTNWDRTITARVGSHGNIDVPVLAYEIAVRVGNTDVNGTVTETVTITDYY